MNQPRPIQLEFMDCKGCGKRVATTANRCRHCNSVVKSPRKLPVIQPNSVSPHPADVDSEDDSHAALALGGYDDYGLSEEDETFSSKKPMEKVYWITAIVLLVVFCLAALVPWLGW